MEKRGIDVARMDPTHQAPLFMNEFWMEMEDEVKIIHPKFVLKFQIKTSL